MTALPAQPISSRDSRKWAWITGLVLLALYLLLQNPYWVPGGDSDFYVACARSIVQEGKFNYNGSPVAISPPGWPMVLAMLMKISPSFLLLKLATMCMMLGSMILSYFIALRFLSPRLAFVAIALTGLLIPVYSLTYFLHSEGLFCLLSAGALLIAFRITENRAHYWEWAVLGLLAASIPLVRWSGIIQLLPICAVLVPGASTIKKGLSWILIGGLVFIVAGAFFVDRRLQELTVQQLQEQKDEGAAPLDSSMEQETKTVALIPTSSRQVSIFKEYGERFLHVGQWFSWFFWQPTRFLAVNKYLDLIGITLGWFVVAVVGWLAMVSIRRRQWLWPVVMLYCLALCMNWPNPNSRYFVPVAPLLSIAVLVGLQRMLKNRPQRMLIGLFVIATALVNLSMYAVDVYVMRAPNFGAHFEAGQHKDLVNIASFFNTWAHPPEDGQIMVNDYYENLNRARNTPAGPRAMTLLTNLKVRTINKSVSKPTAPLYRIWKETYQRHAYYLLVQKPAIPWRVWHFRLPMSLYLKLSKNPDATEPSGGWVLLRRVDDKEYQSNSHFEPIPFPDNAPWPTRVPGM